MLFYSSLCFCVLISISSSLTKDELLSKIDNKHMLTTKDTAHLINAGKSNVYEEYIARDCRAAYLRGRRQNGLYVIRPKYSPLLVVYCDMKYDGGGWTVLHRNNVNTKTTWSHPWHSYKYGFGDLNGNLWLGNQYMHLLTNQNAFSVRFVITDSKGQTKYAEYQSFKVDDEDSGYALRLGNYTGDAGDSLTTIGESGTHDNMRFSAEDKDNDRRASTNCALDNGGGWWYDNCYSALLTGDIRWRGLCSEATPCISATILIRPSGKNCNIPPRY